jgi:hypothetical protein
MVLDLFLLKSQIRNQNLLQGKSAILFIYVNMYIFELFPKPPNEDKVFAGIPSRPLS